MDIFSNEENKLKETNTQKDYDEKEGFWLGDYFVTNEELNELGNMVCGFAQRIHTDYNKKKNG